MYNLCILYSSALSIVKLSIFNNKFFFETHNTQMVFIYQCIEVQTYSINDKCRK